MDFWKDKRVLLTGHTGFKGAWLHWWLKSLGADVHGLALPAATTPSLHRLLFGSDDAPGSLVDIRDAAQVKERVKAVAPEMVFHLAAQPLVRAGYREPHLTFETNVQGTINLLEALRESSSVRAIVVVTTDKVYENPEHERPFREEDPLGGHDPYSASKAACDLCAASYRRSYFLPAGIGLATARAGNVIGGGDWAEDRLVPDVMRAIETQTTLEIRRPGAVRPWQHVLEPLDGYLRLAQRLASGSGASSAYNFGPDPESAATVRQVIDTARSTLPLPEVIYGDGSEGPHEAGYLMLDSTRAKRELGFRTHFDLQETLERTFSWYRGLQAGRNAAELCAADLAAFAEATGRPAGARFT